ncbi:MAG: OsmC family protein [Acidobacteriia bacterium]|nr:OsmC family protein [Terriglobia bacterium]
MQPFPHHYDAHLAGGPTGYVRLTTNGLPELSAAAPKDFDGPGDAWSPEHLLLAAVETCFMLTLRSVAALSKVQFTALDVDIAGTVDRVDGVTRFTEIVLRPRMTVAPGTDHARALRVMEKSEKACLVSASLSTPIRLEPEVREG